MTSYWQLAAILAFSVFTGGAIPFATEDLASRDGPAIALVLLALGALLLLLAARVGP